MTHAESVLHKVKECIHIVINAGMLTLWMHAYTGIKPQEEMRADERCQHTTGVLTTQHWCCRMDNSPPGCDAVIQAPFIWGLSILHHMATESVLGAFSGPSSSPLIYLVRISTVDPRWWFFTCTFWNSCLIGCRVQRPCTQHFRSEFLVWNGYADNSACLG